MVKFFPVCVILKAGIPRLFPMKGRGEKNNVRKKKGQQKPDLTIRGKPEEGRKVRLQVYRPVREGEIRLRMETSA